MICSLATILSARPAENKCLWNNSKEDTSHNNLLLFTSVSNKSKLIQLASLNVSHCNISDINPTIFKGLTNIEDLDFSYNQLTTVPSKMFSYTPNLVILSLKANPISVVKGADFSSIQKLKKLEFSLFKISQLCSDSLGQIPQLEKVYLGGHLLSYVEDPEELSLVSKWSE